MSAGSAAELFRLMTAYDNSQEPKPAFNYSSTVYGLVIPFMVVSYVCVIFRMYTRIRLRCLGWDDFFVILFRISATAGSIFLCLSMKNGFGEHILTIGYDNLIKFQKKFHVCLASYTISTTLIKLSLLSQYIRIFEAGTRARIICWIGLGITTLWGVAFSFCALFPCFPVSGFWNWASPAHCYGFGSKIPSEIAGTFAGHTGSNVVLDMLVLAIPVPLYFRKSTAWRQRVGIGLLLILGLIATSLSIWRLQTILENKAGTYPVLDPTWYGPKSIVLAALEVDLASICASIPTFWPILRQGLLGSIFVTQEVHITHQHRHRYRHRRLSGDSTTTAAAAAPPAGARRESGRFELQLSFSRSPPPSRHQHQQNQHQRASRASSITDIMRVPSATRKGHSNSNDSKSGLTAAAVARHEEHYRDDFVLSSVIPAYMHDKETLGGSQVQSDGQKGFERERERLVLAAVESNHSGGGGCGKSEKTKL